MRPVLVTAASALPVSLAEFKAHLKLDATYAGEDSDLTAKLGGACASIESAIGYPMVHSVWDLRSDEWPCVLPHHQVSALTSITYTDSAGASGTVSASVYSLVGAYSESTATQYVGEARVVLAYGQSWPSVTLATGEPIVTRITSGWKDAASVPADLKLAVLLEATHAYEHRSSVTLGNTAVESKALERGVEHFIRNYVRWRF